jgi:hypothetical protein
VAGTYRFLGPWFYDVPVSLARLNALQWEFEHLVRRLKEAPPYSQECQDILRRIAEVLAETKEILSEEG